jgi:hypothetical protein
MRPHVSAALGQLDLLNLEFTAAAPSPPSGAAERSRGGGGTPALVTRGSGSQTRTHRQTALRGLKRRKSSKRRAGK